MIKLDSKLKVQLEQNLKARAKKQRITGTRRDALVYDTVEDAGYGPRPIKRPKSKW